MSESIRDGWYQVITVFPESLTTVAYRYESGGWWIPDPMFNEASLVGAHLTPLYTVEEARAEAAAELEALPPKLKAQYVAYLRSGGAS